jgi:hypothetical protein
LAWLLFSCEKVVKTKREREREREGDKKANSEALGERREMVKR